MRTTGTLANSHLTFSLQTQTQARSPRRAPRAHHANIPHDSRGALKPLPPSLPLTPSRPLNRAVRGLSYVRTYRADLPLTVQYAESSCAHCVDSRMLSRYPPRPRLTRLDSKIRCASPISSVSSSATSVASTSPPPAMTDLVPQSTPSKDDEQPPSPQRMRLLPEMEDSLPLQDLELMMHWCTTTYRSMARDRSAEALWQVAIPQLSLRFPALRHGLLALSALQLAGATSRGERKWRYLASAREHQTHALTGINSNNAENLTTAQCNASFALCCVLLVFSFGYCLTDDSDEDTDDRGPPDVLDEFLEVFELTRWLVGAMMTTIDRVSAGELYPLVRPDEARPTMPDMSRLVILSLRRHNTIEAERNPAHETDVYDQALEHLRYSLERLMNGGEPKDFAFCWTYRIPVRFQDLVRERQPFALVVLAHYAVVLHHLRESWWMGNWGARILREIVDSLEPEWQELISWPLDATGCLSED
ncbi:hypothetical protein N7462_008927 [Penicillium macrosclerotiorum]|uniref:uncharacterized protein n=1 Tax=Penicillium macrosclerotiorum TaxID=303699 RepID=UPI0025476DD3|nr:uncharacterized protein N7462_008927 [Penicillium macrosclerotiorum]KAJ5676030.1 hypothetical protein N7462_008927 [Penicillium macrosclerotiorum]